MGKVSFRDFIKNNIVILDGATGTELQKRGMPLGVSPEKWALENPKILMDIQKSYIQAGSNVVYTCTFGGNRLKLAEFGLEDKVVEINRELAKISKEAAGDSAYVAGDISATGQFIEPFGDMPFEEAVEIYKEQVKGLLDGGVDLFIIETMVDIQEARAALIAVKESCNLPVCVSMTFDESKRTLTGTDPITALITLQSLGADVVGCNCSTGPEDMIEVIKEMKAYAKVPLLAKPNAGLPRLVNGKTEFDMDALEFSSYVKDLVEAGVNLLGGCCGTSPLYIEKIKENAKNLKPKAPCPKKVSCVTSARKTVFSGFDEPVIVVGERINPTGKKKLQEELKEGKKSEIRRFAFEQVEKGADILDVNVGMPGIDEKKTMVETLQFLSTIVEAPLCIDSSSYEVIEAALRVYPGRAIINSISAEKKKIEKLLPIAAKYGAMFILLPLNDEGVPEASQERCKIIEYVYKRALEYCFEKEDIIVDGLVMTVSSDQNAALETLKVIEWCRNEFGIGSILGLSNVSFGLPERNWINTAFLSMAIGRGLTMAIANPSSEILMSIKMACDVLMVKDKNSAKYIEKFGGKKSTKEKAVEKAEEKPHLSTLDKIYNAVLTGDRENIKELIDAAIKEGNEPSKIVDDYLIPAITKVGDLYDKREYFLPQLIQSAQTMKEAFGIVEPLLIKGDRKENKKCVVLATVKGDIHDIGKNIVGLMLRNYGFKVIDLGKDVMSEKIVETAKRENAHIIGLSALMTTTMVEMREVVKLAKKEGVKAKIMIGGAVVDSDYAKEIGADGYSEDAYAAVKLAEKLSAF
ncbi:homocysteine S-methyltransferase family protein [Acetivibrio saccincola]|jgi:5-methyltetrahydrofolate--homocysteine methyltransferase|uniref:Methionine synthase n=1 Tax=Acetivibrio saccincola TaxID=1677857 RepID=A0A2K9E3A4_9FIRM|nr:homocysteine S-methyltransferase family protein [Acetivibrio saccincola]AUG57849.1 Methionine synthase [Acetivibrio saccincola]NLW26784.1 dihydropteroate synthase [Acetivibrio saccincola]HOA97513.1 homocysteine S-methyltransferase family protein [Acetivibrio saccincola]HQD29313.1 homocysteine S-methyltransferase family protein [Acetivibrio saccincola]